MGRGGRSPCRGPGRSRAAAAAAARRAPCGPCRRAAGWRGSPSRRRRPRRGRRRSFGMASEIFSSSWNASDICCEGCIEAHLPLMTRKSTRLRSCVPQAVVQEGAQVRERRGVQVPAEQASREHRVRLLAVVLERRDRVRAEDLAHEPADALRWCALCASFCSMSSAWLRCLERNASTMRSRWCRATGPVGGVARGVAHDAEQHPRALHLAQQLQHAPHRRRGLMTSTPLYSFSTSSTGSQSAWGSTTGTTSSRSLSPSRAPSTPMALNAGL